MREVKRAVFIELTSDVHSEHGKDATKIIARSNWDKNPNQWDYINDIKRGIRVP